VVVERMLNELMEVKASCKIENAATRQRMYYRDKWFCVDGKDKVVYPGETISIPETGARCGVSTCGTVYSCLQTNTE
jgi:hypothetical protein